MVGRKSHRRSLIVAMNGDLVGRLERVTHGDLRFRYDPAWLERPEAVPISLSLPLSPDPYAGERVWSYFDNLLPDGTELRERLALSLGAESPRPFDLLAVTGRDCVGALQLLETPDLRDVRTLDATPVTDAWIAERLRRVGSHPLGMDREDPGFRISIAGSQEKTALLRRRGAWYRPDGPTPTTHILKRPIGPIAHGIDLSDSIENEWLCSRIVRAFGLEIADTDRASFDGVDALVVERFDRRWSEDGSWLLRLPQEDFCQALGVPPQKKYQSDGGPGIREALDLLQQSRSSARDRRAFFKAQVVYWLLAAIDGHAKNFSLFLEAGGRSTMTPLYDVLSAYPVIARGQLPIQDARMAMAVQGKSQHYRWQEIVRRHWTSTAAGARFPREQAEEILGECVTRLPGVLQEVSGALPSDFPSEVSHPILDGVERAGRRLDPP